MSRSFFVKLFSVASLVLGASSFSALAADNIAPPNYDESKVPQFVLPDPLVAEDGTKIDTPELWFQKRRPEILAQFQHEMYGKFPEADLSKIKFEELKSSDQAFDGKATLKEIRIYFNAPEQKPYADLLVLIPNKRDGAVPAFLMPNFQGNHTTSDVLDITTPDAADTTHPDSKKGVAKTRWSFERIIDRGYAIATVFYEQLEPDRYDEFKSGVHPLFTNFNIKDGDYPATISAWAWGLSRCYDCLQTLPEIDSSKVIILGHSRLGKTALWCGANDQRFAAVVSNDSGCGGAALSRREFGERVDRINASFPHWFTMNFRAYGSKVNDLPMDQHELIALIAPRPVYVASASQDEWADPKGEFLSALYADPVYRLLGTDGIGGVTEQPEVDTPVGSTIRYHKRTGKHDVTDYDWQQYLNFADAIFSK